MDGICRLLAAVRLDEARLDDARLVDRRTDGRADRCAAVRGREAVDFGLAVLALGFAVVALAEEALPALRDLEAARLVVLEPVELVDPLIADRDLLELLDLLVVLGRVVEEVDLRAEDDRRAAGRRVDAAGVALAVDIVLAAAVSAFAAAVMDLVAVFIARIADDIVWADDVALVAAAVILVAADVTFVAADDTVFAADAGVVVLREVLRVERPEVLRVERDAVRREAVLRVDRAEVLRLDRDAGFRVVDVAVPAGLAAVLRDADDVARPLALVVLGRLAVPDALRLTDLLRAVLAGLRRVAARVVV